MPEAVKPAPLQEAAFVELQVRVEDCPDEIEVGLAASAAVGVGPVAGGGDDPEPELEPEHGCTLVWVE